MPNNKVPQDPTLPQGFNATFRQRFWSCIQQSGSCLVWTGTIIDGGYGIINRGCGGGNMLAHCAAWILKHGTIPKQRLHHCCPNGNRNDCVNPDHLRFDSDPLNPQVFAGLLENGFQEMFISPEFLESLGFSPCAPLRFLKSVIKTDRCWPWIGAIGSSGRGVFGCTTKKGSRLIGAHVASFIFHKGPIPEGKWVLHDCPDGDRGDCVNPAHLWIGDGDKNMEDCSKKRRHASSLTWEQVCEIRSKWPKQTTRALASEYGVSKSAVWSAISRNSWFHIPYDQEP